MTRVRLVGRLLTESGSAKELARAISAGARVRRTRAPAIVVGDPSPSAAIRHSATSSAIIASQAVGIRMKSI
jgi:hypothetical protein